MLCCKKKREQKPLPDVDKLSTDEALQLYYQARLLPCEQRHAFSEFHGPHLTDAELVAKPAVLLLGQYSTGKTTFIKYLIRKDYPGSRIGPEPTTDTFTVVLHKDTDRELFGNTLVSDNNFPYQSLSLFGNNFLNKLRGACVNSPLLEQMTFIDTPGVVTSNQSNMTQQRGYDYIQVIRFFADRVDRIILMFDTSKLDISDEYRHVIQACRGNDEKIKILLNKADNVPPDELIQVRGALMWNLGKILQSPEIPKVFIGSFMDGKPHNKAVRARRKLLRSAFKRDHNELMNDLRELPKTSKARKINDVVKRGKTLYAHCLIMDELIRGMWLRPSAKRIAKAIKKPNLEKIYAKLVFAHGLLLEDMPEIELFRERALASNPARWQKCDPELLAGLHTFLLHDVSRIIQALPPDDKVVMANIQRQSSGSDRSASTKLDDSEPVEEQITQSDRKTDQPDMIELASSPNDDQPKSKRQVKQSSQKADLDRYNENETDETSSRGADERKKKKKRQSKPIEPDETETDAEAERKEAERREKSERRSKHDDDDKPSVELDFSGRKEDVKTAMPAPPKIDKDDRPTKQKTKPKQREAEKSEKPRSAKDEQQPSKKEDQKPKKDKKDVDEPKQPKKTRDNAEKKTDEKKVVDRPKKKDRDSTDKSEGSTSKSGSKHSALAEDGKSGKSKQKKRSSLKGGKEKERRSKSEKSGKSEHSPKSSKRVQIVSPDGKSQAEKSGSKAGKLETRKGTPAEKKKTNK